MMFEVTPVRNLSLRNLMPRIRLRKILTGVALVFTSLVMPPSASFSQPADFPAAVKAFNERRFEEAKQIFLALEAEHPNNPTLLLNLGLIAQREKRLGAALGLWRKGLALHPADDALLNAVDWVRPKLPKAEVARRLDLWETWRSSLFGRVSPLATISLSALFLFASGAYLLRWWGARRRAFSDESALPPLPIAGLTLAVLFVFLFSISAAILVDRLDVRGTIVTEKIEVRSAPEPSATTLFEAFEGMEVIVRESRNVETLSWRRITYPGGGTGWIRDFDVFMSTDPSSQAFKAQGVQP